MIVTSFLWYYGVNFYAKSLQYIALRDCPRTHLEIDLMDQEQLHHVHRMYVHPALLLPTDKLENISIVDEEVDREKEGVSLDEELDNKPALFRSPSSNDIIHNDDDLHSLVTL